MARDPFVVVTNFNRNFTGVSATAAAVLRRQARELDVVLCGHPLPGCPGPVPVGTAISLGRKAAHDGRPVIWHVRRNPEMRRAIIARDLLRVPMKVVFTSAAKRRHSAWPRWLIGRMDAVVATTEEAAGFVPNVRAVVPHGVDTEMFRPAADRAAAWAATGFPGTRGVATVGRVRPEKGTDRFVDAMIAVLPEFPDVTALVVGAATAEFRGFARDLERRIAGAGLSGRILFTGELPQERLGTIYSALSLLVAAPRYEGYGMTALEAMASGVPVVATDAGNFSAILDDGTGALIDQRDEGSIAGAVRSFLADPARADAAGAASRRRVEALFSVDREAEALGEVYRALAGE